MILETQRLVIRPVDASNPKDVEGLRNVYGTPEVVKDLWIDLGSERGFTDDEVDARITTFSKSFARNGYCKYGVFLRDSNSLIGYCGLEDVDFPGDGPREAIELGYRFLPSAHGKGIATEACFAVLDDTFERLGLSEVVATVSGINDASIRVLEKLGFVDWDEFVFKSDLGIEYVLWKCVVTPETFEWAKRLR